MRLPLPWSRPESSEQLRENDEHLAGQFPVRSRVFPYDIHLFGPESRAAEALQAGTGTSYAFQGAALSGSTLFMFSGINARVRYAYGNLIWTPGATGCGVELLKADGGPSNIEQIAEFTGNAATTPVNSGVNITTEMQAVVDFTAADIPGGANQKQIGYRAKGNGSVGPLIYACRVQILFEA